MILAGDLAAGAKLNEASDRRAARRFARPGARGVPRARGIGPRAPGEEPRRVRAPDQPSRKPTRSTSCARCSTSSPAAASRRRSTAADMRDLRALVERMDRPPRATTSTPTTRPTSIPRPAGRARRQRASCSRPTGGWSTSCTSTAARTLAQAGALPRLDARAPRDRRQDRRRPGRRRRPRAVRARDGQPRAHAPCARRARRAAAGAARAHGEAR